MTRRAQLPLWLTTGAPALGRPDVDQIEHGMTADEIGNKQWDVDNQEQAEPTTKNKNPPAE